jgi:primosomal protein N' (replication factor Y) (superfamily II helicase)
MISAAPSTRATPERGAAVLSGPVAVCVDRPLLSLDRPFTYELLPELEAGVGSLVQVRFHGKLVRGWVLGPTGDVPARMLKVHKRVSPVRFFDERMLDLYRWIGERYVAPLAAVIARSYPPRVVSEEGGGVVAAGGGAPRRSAPTGEVEMDSLGFAPRPTALRDGTTAQPLLSDGYVNGPRLLSAIRDGSGTYLVRSGPGEEAALSVECVGAALAGGRGAIVLVPEVDPMPGTVRAMVDAFGEDVACFFGGDKRSRYRTWLDIAEGRYRVVVGTRPAVFAPVPKLGLLFVGREHHALHREERSPYFHVRDVAVARAARQGAVGVIASVMPSLEGLELPHVDVVPLGRRWPRVEAVKPGPEGRAPRLVAALRQARRAFLYEPIRGYGVARVCRTCGEAAACASCGGMLRSEEGSIRCIVCEAPGRCAACGGEDFGVARGGAERVEQWARGVAAVPVARLGPSDRPRPPVEAEVVVGGIDAVKDFGALELDLVGILNADASLRRAGIAARERTLTAWAEVAAWAGPSGRVVLQTNRPNDPAVQALVAGKPDRFARTEKQHLADAGFPIGAPVFRVVGTASLADEMAALPHRTLLVSPLEEQTVCLVALDPGDVVVFGAAIRRLAERGIVTRVEAEPHL